MSIRSTLLSMFLGAAMVGSGWFAIGAPIVTHIQDVTGPTALEAELIPVFGTDARWECLMYLGARGLDSDHTDNIIYATAGQLKLCTPTPHQSQRPNSDLWNEV